MPDPLKSSKQFGSLKLSKISDSLRLSKPSDSLKLSMPSDSSQRSKSETRRKPRSSESLQLAKIPDSHTAGKISGIERMSPVAEHARGLLNRHKTLGKGSDLDAIAPKTLTVSHDLKSDYFSISPLTHYMKNQWSEKSDLPVALSIEEVPRAKRDLYKNPYLELDGDDYESTVVLKSDKNRKTGDILKSLREKKRSSNYSADGVSDAEDDVSAKGAYAIKYVVDDDDEVEVKPRRSKLSEIDDNPNEMALSQLVSAAALRAKSVLENLTGLFGKGGMVNVEGDIKPYGGKLTTFRLHTPFHFEGPLMIGETPAVSVGDDSFGRYLTGMQGRRKEERDRVEQGARRMTKLTRSLGNDSPREYSLRPIGYISDKNYDNFSKSLVPITTKFDKTIISPSRKKVHFDEGDEQKQSNVSLSRELVPFSIKGAEDEGMAVVPKRKKRYPIYEYTEDIPLKLAIGLNHGDGDDPEKLSVLEKIRIKALLVGDDKLDDPDRPRSSRPRKPRTRYYADKLHEMDHKENLSTLMAAPHTPHTVTVKASRPAKYRLDSRLEPEDLLSKPSSYGSMRDQVRGVQDKLDRHRQLMDRHSDRPGADHGHGDSHAAGGGLSAGRTTEEGGAGGDGLGKVSPLRRKLRKVICKSRHDPSYYDE